MNKFLPLALLIGFSLTGNTMAKTGTSALPDVKISQLPDTQQAPEHSTVSERVTSGFCIPITVSFSWTPNFQRKFWNVI